MNYGVGENIPFVALLFKNNGAPDIGLLTRITIFNDNTSTKIINSVLMTEVQAGYYRYLWTNNAPVNTTLSYYIEVANAIVASGKVRIVDSPGSIRADIQLARNEIASARAELSTARADILADALSKLTTIVNSITTAKDAINENIDTGESTLS